MPTLPNSGQVSAPKYDKPESPVYNSQLAKSPMLRSVEIDNPVSYFRALDEDKHNLDLVEGRIHADSQTAE